MQIATKMLWLRLSNIIIKLPFERMESAFFIDYCAELCYHVSYPGRFIHKQSFLFYIQFSIHYALKLVRIHQNNGQLSEWHHH